MKKFIFFLSIGALYALCSCENNSPEKKSSVELILGQSKEIVVDPGTQTQFSVASATGSVAWSSSNEYVSVITESGLAYHLCYGEAVITAICGGQTATCTVKVNEKKRSYELVWQDEFEGSSLNISYWNIETFAGGGNREIQQYLEKNVTVSDGYLHLMAKKEKYGSYNYTSGRIQTKDKVKVRYGKIEASISLPNGMGNWPAFWMMPNDNVYGVWPNSGEIDIMEHVGSDVRMLSNAVHTKQRSGGNSWQQKTYWDDIENNFHTYSIEWLDNYWNGCDAIIFYKDGVQTAIKYQSSPAVSTSTDWPFDQDFYIVLNLAIGGTWGGTQIDDTAFPMDMKIDWVRVYKGTN